MGISCTKQAERNDEIRQHKQSCFNQMQSTQDNHCAGLSDLYAFDTKFQTPQNYEDDDEHISDIHLNNFQERSEYSSLQNLSSQIIAHPLDSLKQSQNSISSQSDSQTFTYGKEKNQSIKFHNFFFSSLELKCVLFNLKDSLNLDVRYTTF